ncbi:MAG: hypothetical protein LAQ69_24965 [Acidobacteriia bacterium]|nr:hypothetical protein [Terriglobia bacterium]
MVAQHKADLARRIIAPFGPIEFLGQEGAGALLKEEMLGHLVDEDFFIDADGLVIFDQGGEELLSNVAGFIGHQSNAGTEAVAQGVLTNGGFAVVCARSSGLLSIATIGFELGL